MFFPKIYCFTRDVKSSEWKLFKETKLSPLVHPSPDRGRRKCSKYEELSTTWKFVRWLRPRSWKVMMAGPWKRETKCIKRFFLVSLFIPLDFQPGRQGRGHRGRSGSPRWQDRMLAEIIQFNLISLKFMICKFTLVTGCRLKLFQRHYLMIKEKWWCEKI